MLDEELEKFRSRPLVAYPYVFLDARYEKVRHDGQVIDQALLVAVGVADNGKEKSLESLFGSLKLRHTGEPFYKSLKSVDFME